MEYVTVQCPKCGGSLQAEQTTKKIFCMYCRTEVTVRKTETSGATADSLIRRGFLLLEQRDWQKASEIFDQAANIEPENAKVYLGMLLAERRIMKEEDLIHQSLSLGHSIYYQRLIQFADPEFKKRVEAYNEAILAPRKEQKTKKQFLISEKDKIKVEAHRRLKEEHHWKKLRRFSLYYIIAWIVFSTFVGFSEHQELFLENILAGLLSSVFLGIFFGGGQSGIIIAVIHLWKVDKTKKRIAEELWEQSKE